MATYQTEVDAVLLAIVTAEDTSTLSKTLANNKDQTMHDTAFAKDMLREYFAGIRDSATYNGSAILESLKGELNEILGEAING